MKKIFLALLLLLCTAPSFAATCTFIGTSLGSLQTGAADAIASATISGISGCTIALDSITATLVNSNGSAAASLTLAVYQNNTCTGTPVWTAALGVTGVKGSTTVYSATFSNVVVNNVGEGICVAFTSAATGIIQTAGFSAEYE
jgi:hypothetical protein